MINPDFLTILNEIKEKEYSFRDITFESNPNRVGVFEVKGADVMKEDLFGIVIGFLIYLKYKRIIPFEGINNKIELSYALSKSQHRKAEELFSIWNEIGDNYPYLDKLLALLLQYDFSAYQSSEQELELAHWCNENYLLDGKTYFALCPLDKLVSLSIVFECQKQLGVNFEVGELLVIAASEETIKYLLRNNTTNRSITFSNCGPRNTIIKINALLLDCYSNIQLSDKNSNLYDSVIVEHWRNNESSTWDSYLNLVKVGGCLLALGTQMSEPSKNFYENEIPLILDSTSGVNLLCRKIKDDSKVVRYGFYQSLSDFNYSEKDNIINRLTECIKNNISFRFYQILSKIDFEVSGKIRFHEVKRLPDQINFIWKKKEEIISIDEDDEWLYDTNISEDRIINNNEFSKNPFITKARNDFYLAPQIYMGDGHRHVLEDCFIEHIEGNADCSYEIRNESAGVFRQCYQLGTDEVSEEFKDFDKALCCRVLTHPSILYFWGTVLKVEASPTRPICYRKYAFYFNEDYFDVTCTVTADCIKINPEYDENFILYQLTNEKKLSSKYLLVAPTKEEQHTFFINKRLDYLSKYRPAIDEIEEEIQRSVSESPTYITGMGFTNFRRFVNLPLLPLAGVNILVGGNNAGKSSFVKGLLLMFDNIKNLVITNTENYLLSTRFQYDTNNFHDVHIGTFDRAYSNNAIEEVNEGVGRRTMSFSMSFAHFELRLLVSPVNNEGHTSVPIAKILVIDHKRNAQFAFDLENMRTSAVFSIGEEKIDYNYSGLVFNQAKYGEHKIVSLLRSLVSTRDNSSILFADAEQVKKIQSKAGFILEIADELEQIINNTTIEYIYAHGVNQKVLFNYNDKNDYMAQTLHDFINEKIGDVEHEFICKWLEEFGLGCDYDIHSIGGEAYIIQVKDKSGKMIYLADMGMGANQLVILILRLAIIIHKHRMGGSKVYRPTIVIEEPEQNMHPEYQSKLAVLFHEMHETYGFNFILETHSEYLVRRSQVLVAHKKFKDDDELKANNPFKVYYFPTDGLPYEMQYRKDGNFRNEFGKGFYDEASNLLFEII